MNIISDVNSKIAALEAGETVDVSGTINTVVSTEKSTEQNTENTEKKESTEKKETEENDSEQKESKTKDTEKTLENAEKEAIAELAPQEQLLVAKRKAIESYNAVLATVNGNAYTDDDADGMIYIQDIDPGDYFACYVPTADYDAASYTTQVNVKEKIEYKKVENIKDKKAEYNASEDKEQHAATVESVMPDTVAYVESKEVLIPVKCTNVNDLVPIISTEYNIIEQGYSATRTFSVTNEPSTQAENRTIASMKVNKSVVLYAGNATADHCALNVAFSNVSSIKGIASDDSLIISGENGNFTIKARNLQETKKTVITFTGTVDGTFDNGTNTFTTTCEVTIKGTTEKIKDASGNPVYIDENAKTEATVADYNRNATLYTQPQYKYYGWQTQNKIRYYYDQNGNKVTGVQVIAGSKYTFGSDGALLTSGYGIDVSKWQGNIDWSQASTVASFALIRCGGRFAGDRSLFEDPYFKQNMQGAQTNGVKVGVYSYSTAMNEVEAVEEASLALELVKGYSLSLPIYFDFEDPMQRDGLSKDQKNAIMNAFVRTIQNGGRTAGVYSYHDWLSKYVDMNTLPGNVSVWVAQFSDTLAYKGRYDIWQYTSKGSIPGISGRVDMNISYF